MEKIWFIYAAEIVSGPFATEQVKSDLLAGRWDAQAQIWWKGQKEWLTIDRWYSQLEEILESNRLQGQQPVWYAEQHNNQVGPMTKNDLVQHLKDLPDVKSVRLWTVGLNHWTNLFEFHEIMGQLGLSKRSFDRAPIVGSVVLHRHGELIEKHLASVSGGGVGISDSGNLVPGEIVTVSVKSPLLISPVRAAAKVMYIEDSGFAGLQFQNIHIESKTALMDYVRQFKNDGANHQLDATQVRRAV